MKCPKCNDNALSFTKWCVGTNAISTECSSCGIELKANYIVYIGILITVIATVAAVPFVNDFWVYLDITLPFKSLRDLFPAACGVMYYG